MSGQGLGMAPETRPSNNAVIASLPDGDAVSAVLRAIAEQTSIDPGHVAHGTGDAFALKLEGSEDETGPATRMGKWLLSLGQEREELVELGQAAREGEHAIVVNDVEDEATKDAVIAILKGAGGSRILHIGQWQSEEVL